ncbi:cbb3-type cytochrome c oxidase N-terminal domain-containing protein [Salegentibacter salegens]|uniref:Cytochrome c oxidase cbb3-type subunit 3 n=1 Tax=Salegentibacter salegens TaxID=143223 RepID=A0A1M7LBJ0_9FLAO|nr:cbb3-type cytochrome c oxidase N-terminal domain-containing protein [Salegentibacter salegens]PRX50596.1 cytochrome c oxidase cbb3-type subunit 3 [Salegentibacter salegens]SHM75470.1 cytochrome c oxidase cbb3-type subunit 3 [Salegentibacter salegens]
MKKIAYLRILGFLILALILIELTVETESGWAIEQYPVIWWILAVVLVIAVAIEVSLAALESMVFKSLKPDAQQHYTKLKIENSDKQFVGLKKFYKKMLNQQPVEKEEEILLDHNYDGIKELDNDLPAWWLYGFYISIVFAFVYMAYYHIFDGETQREEYLAEVAKAEKDVEAYKAENPDLIDASSVELLTEASDLEAGEQIFMTSCMACHKADGGGSIGPNLTDEHWILGGGISNVFQTVSEGGRDGKGMVAWKSELNAQEIAQVSSYVLSLQGTNPPDAKAPEGDIWVADSE